MLIWVIYQWKELIIDSSITDKNTFNTIKIIMIKSFKTFNELTWKAPTNQQYEMAERMTSNETTYIVD